MAALPEGDPAPIDGELPNKSDLKSKPFSLYVHVPYCAKRCGYCDFNTYVPSELDKDDQIQSWLTSAIKELDLIKKVTNQDLVIDTIFFGGGTPSLLEPEVINEFLENVSRRYSLKSKIEITLEANPDTITQEKSDYWLASGVNRISIGMQSSTKNVLQTLDRTHNPENVLNSVKILKDAGFKNYSLDLIYGTPGESLEDWDKTLNDALALEPPHISAYSLVIEPGTKMGAQLNRGEISNVSDDDAADKYSLAEQIFSSRKYEWYEISNWSRSEMQCQHNLNYWRGNNWWGIGPGAHSHINGVRWWNEKLPKNWREKLTQHQSPALAREVLSESQIKDEKLMLLSRLRTGIKSKEVKSSARNSLIEQGLIYEESENIVLTLKGRLLADVVFRHLSE